MAGRPLYVLESGCQWSCVKHVGLKHVELEERETRYGHNCLRMKPLQVMVGSVPHSSETFDPAGRVAACIRISQASAR